jgi:hypothetical protein
VFLCYKLKGQEVVPVIVPAQAICSFGAVTIAEHLAVTFAKQELQEQYYSLIITFE